MNWLKWIVCWFNKEHIFIYYYDKDGTTKRICVRCGYIK